jgi:hypothetical protein
LNPQETASETEEKQMMLTAVAKMDKVVRYGPLKPFLINKFLILNVL